MANSAEGLTNMADHTGGNIDTSDDWAQRICDWADEFDIDDKNIPRDKEKLVAMTDFDVYIL